MAVAGIEEQRAHLGVAGQVVGEEQRGVLPMNPQRARGTHGQTDAEVVPGLAQADRAVHRRDADHLAGIGLQHEQVVGVRALGLAAEGFFRPDDPLGQALLVGRQRSQAGTGAARHGNQRGQVGTADGTNDHGASC
ncbi:hypothetical protein D3C86_1645850 [compost metagenome]